MRQGIVRACHDLSEGGLGVAAAEMCIAGRLGMALRLPQNDAVVALFSESNGRLLVEVPADGVAAFREAMDGCPLAELGVVTGDSLRVTGSTGDALFELPVADLVAAWRRGAA